MYHSFRGGRSKGPTVWLTARSLAGEAGAAAASSSSPGLEAISASLRREAGSHFCEKLRKTGRTPSILFSLPGNKSQLISVDSKQISKLVHGHGRQNMQSRLFKLELEPHEGQDSASINVLPRNIHINAATDLVENVTFMHCPPERQIEVYVPVMVIGEETSPGMKAGGFVNTIRKVIRCSCPGNTIPPFIEVDVSHLSVGQRIGLDAVKLPPGVRHLEKIPDQPVVKMAGRRGS